MRVAGVLVRRSVTVWAGVLVAGVELWLALGAVTPGLNLWTDLVTGLSTASLFVGVIAAGFSAFEAGRWAPSARQAHGIPRDGAVVQLLHAGAAAVPILAGYLLALTILAIYGRTTETYGSPSIGWLIALGCALLAATGFGWIIGTIGRGLWWVAPGAAIAFYGVYVFVQALPVPRGLRALYPVVLQADFVFVRPVLPTLLGMAACSVGVVALALALLAPGRGSASRRTFAIICTATGLLIIGGAVSAVSRDGQYTEPYAPQDNICARGTAIVCLNTGYAAALPALSKHVEELNARTAGTPLAAKKLEQDIEGGPAPSPGTRSIHIEQLAASDDITFAVYRYVTEYGTSPTCSNNGTDSSGARSLVTTWLSGYGTSDLAPSDKRLYQRLGSLSTADGNAWFRTHYQEYFTCKLRLSDLP